MKEILEMKRTHDRLVKKRQERLMKENPDRPMAHHLEKKKSLI